MESSLNSFVVLLEDLGNVSPTVLAETLATYKKIPFADASFLVRHAHGFLAASLEEPDAQSLVSLLSGKGIKALALPASSIKPLPPVQRAVELTLGDKTIDIKLENGMVETVSEDRGVVIAAAVLPLRTTTITRTKVGPSAAEKAVKLGLIAMGVPLPIGGKTRIVEKKQTKEEYLYYVSILCSRPLAHYQIDAQHFSFAFLKDLMKYDSFQNVKVVLSEVARRFPSAILGIGARLLMKNEPISKMSYESMDDMEKELRGLAARLALKDIP